MKSDYATHREGRSDIDVKDLKLKQVYPSLTDSVNCSKIDIVLIHGKAAHPYKTWTKQSPEQTAKDGPRSAFKKEYLDWTTQSPVRAYFALAIAEIDQIASARRTCVNRPLLFVAHSFGGLVLAKALADAWHDQTRWPEIYAATVGAVFLGTPFRGTTHLLHLSILPQIESRNEFVLRDNIESSKADSEWLHHMFSDFCRSIRECAEDQGKAPSIACYFEREPTDLSFYLRNSEIAQQDVSASARQYRDIVVSESSACLDNTSTALDIQRFSRACDHLNLHRFTDLEDQEWITFKQVLQDFANNRPRLSKTYREQLIASLTYHNMNARHSSLPEPCKGTYSWIYTKAPDDRREWHSFDEWLRGNEPTYWVSGRAGSGKSVLLAHIIDNPKTLEQLQCWSGRTNLQLLSFFFWKPGTGLENTLRGLLQSCLHQLCQIEAAVIMSEVVKELHLPHGQLPSWTVSRLTRVLHAVFRATETTRRYCVFIDGLDEFTGDQLDLLDFVQKLRHCANVKCCVSSRPEWPFEKALHSVPRLKLEGFNYHDISLFVQIAFSRAGAASEKELMEEICTRAGGVFLWAALVTKDVLRGLEAHDELRVLKSRIEKLPLDLIELYRKMLERVDQEHRDYLAFYVQCLAAPSARLSLFTSMSILTADRLDKILTSYEDFAAECEITAVQIKTRSGGLLEICGDEGEKCERFERRFERPESEWIVVQDVGDGQALMSRRQLARRGHYISALHSETQQIRWVHRSAYEFIFEYAAAQALNLPSRKEVSARLWRATLAYIRIAPSVYCSNNVCIHSKQRQERPKFLQPLANLGPGRTRSHSGSIGGSEVTTTCNNGSGRCIPHPRTLTALRVTAMLELARMDKSISYDQMAVLFDVVANIDIDEFWNKPLESSETDCDREKLRTLSKGLTKQGAVMFWALSRDLDYSRVSGKLPKSLIALHDSSLAIFLLAFVVNSIATLKLPWVFRPRQGVQPWIPTVLSIMRYFTQRLDLFKRGEHVTEDAIITSAESIREVVKCARSVIFAPGYDSEYEIGLRCRRSLSLSNTDRLGALTCAAIACVGWAWSQLPFLHHEPDPTIEDSARRDYMEARRTSPLLEKSDDLALSEHVRSCFHSFHTHLAFRYMSPHCPKLYFSPFWDAQISCDVGHITRSGDNKKSLNIAQAVRRLDIREISLSSPMEDHTYEREAFWEITSELTKRAAITAEYELRVMAEPARQAGKSLEDFWGAGSDELVAYRATRDRYREWIDRAFDEDIAQETALGRFDSHPRTNAYDLDNDQL